MCGSNCTVGSNPTLSATHLKNWTCVIRIEQITRVRFRAPVAATELLVCNMMFRAVTPLCEGYLPVSFFAPPGVESTVHSSLGSGRIAKGRYLQTASSA